MSDLEIKEMSLEEKYDKLYDSYILTDVIAMAFIMENGLTDVIAMAFIMENGLADEYLNYTMKVYKKMMPSIMDYAFKFIKTLSPGRAFKMFVEGILKDGQVTEPLSNTELVSLSGREEVIRTKNSVMLKKYRDIIKKTGVKLDLKEYFELFPEAGKEMVKEFGFDMTMDTSHIQEDEITSTIKLKK